MDALGSPDAPMGIDSRGRRCNSGCGYWLSRDVYAVTLTHNPELHVKTVKYFKSIERVQDEVEAMHAEFRNIGGTDIVGGME